MKIVCDNCGAKYRIADEKAQGKTFKLRCKRCEDVIRVEGDGAAESEDGLGSGFGEDYGGDATVEWYAVIDGDRAGPITSDEVAAYVSEGVLDGESYVWRTGLDDWEPLREIDSLKHLVDDGAAEGDPAAADPAAESGYEQTRVMDPSQTGALSADESDASDTQEGVDWDKTTEEMPSDEPDPGDGAAVSEADPEALEPEETVQEVGDANSEHDGMFAGVSDPDETATGSSGSSASQVSGVWSSSSGTFESFDDAADSGEGASSQHTSRTAGPGVSDELVDQRNENSVLFSLDGVDEVNAVDEESDESEATGAGATTEGSGLIDIQSLAATHAAMSSDKEEEGATRGGAAPATQASGSGQMNNMPNLAPSGSRSNNTALIVAIVVGALILAAAGIAAVYVMTQDQEPQRVQRVAEANKQGTPSGPEGDETKADQASAESNPQAVAAAGDDAGTADAGTATASAGADAAEEGDEPAEEDPEKRAEAEQEAKQTETEPEPEPEPTRTAKRRESSGGSGGDDDDLDKLLGNVGKGSSSSGGGSGGGGGTAAQQESDPAEDLPEKPSRSMVMDTIRKYSGRVNNCGQKSNKEKLSGTCKVKFTVEPSGQTSNVSVQSSDFKGTDVGNCVRGVVQSMSFPKTQEGMPVLFPFKVN
jgi:predicted Zn finger-like uncharacterized protein